MRIKIIGENNCARATRHLLRLAGFAVTEFLPVDALAGGPLAGYAITIELAPAHTPDARLGPPTQRADYGGQAHQRPDPPAHHLHASDSEEAPQGHSPSHRDASSPAFAEAATAGSAACDEDAAGRPAESESAAGEPAGGAAHFRGEGRIYFDSVECELESAVLRHVTQLAAEPVIVDRPGGVVHSDRELRIVAPNTGDARVDEAAAVAIEFGVLRGMLDMTAPASVRQEEWRTAGGKLADALAREGKLTGPFAKADKSAEAPANSRSEGGKKWWPFGLLFLGLLCGAGFSPAKFLSAGAKSHRLPFIGALSKEPAPLWHAALAPLALGLAAADPQEQLATGQGFKITDGTNGLVIDPCKAQAKSYASISQTANTQLVAGAASKKIYVCSIHVVAAAAANVAVVEGTGTVCGTGTAGVSGFGGATAATGWNFAANGGIALGNGDSSLGAEGTGGDNLCIFNSGSSQVSGGISYVVL